MDDAEYIYKQDVKEKAITARSSHKYGSSRRRRCGLSSDNLTRKEWERMNGPVHTLKPDEALSWDRFRALPRSLQQDYIKHILSKFKVGPAALSRMFGVSEAYCGDYLKKQLGITFQGRTTRQETLRFLDAYRPDRGPVCADKKKRRAHASLADLLRRLLARGYRCKAARSFPRGRSGLGYGRYFYY